MRQYRCRGTITVFLSLISVLFLSLLCTSIESARIQGSRAKAAAALDMGLFSVLGEFERGLLEKYDVFFLDGAYGGGSYSRDHMTQKLQEYMDYNASPNKGLLFRGVDMFPVKVKEVDITGVQLATDEKGEAFYQQAVGFMKENLGTELVSTALQRMNDAKKLEQAGQDYERQDRTNETQLSTLQQQQAQEKQRIEEEQKAAVEASGGEVQETEAQLPAVKPEKNPLEVIKAIRRKGLLRLLLGTDAQISQKKLPGDIPSKRKCERGNLTVERKHRGLTADLIFQEYLFQRFSLFTDEKKEGILDYALEYILCGKSSDEKNLKSVVTRLLLLREGANFAYITTSPEKKGEADALAALLVGAIPIPGLIPATSYALQLVWAYAESLLDVRELLLGGKVPLFKEAADWRLSLSSIPELLDILYSAGGSGDHGVSYSGYLQMLFTLGKKSAYPMRALDMAEGVLKSMEGMESFRADHAVCKISATSDFSIPPMFLKVSAAFLKTGVVQTDYHASGSFSYY
ncbi:MAG: DUF5702 domain-containing protein [Eubacteriales bacterium]|nr:DUF5702 domain-containing protein [Eubacteriales bacterium]